MRLTPHVRLQGLSALTTFQVPRRESGQGLRVEEAAPPGAVVAEGAARDEKLESNGSLFAVGNPNAR
jgi:hypothetical protein